MVDHRQKVTRRSIDDQFGTQRVAGVGSDFISSGSGRNPRCSVAGFVGDSVLHFVLRLCRHNESVRQPISSKGVKALKISFCSRVAPLCVDYVSPLGHLDRQSLQCYRGYGTSMA